MKNTSHAISSMTGFARKELKADWGNAAWEIRSVNQRYLETYFRLPEQFRSLEPILRERFRKALTRGKVECNLRIEFNQGSATEIQINESFAEQLIQAAKWVQTQSQQGTINPLDILRWPGVIASQEQDTDAINQTLLGLFNETLDEFIAMRQREGAALKTLIEQRLASIKVEVEKVRQQMPAVIEWQKNRLLTKIEEASIEIDNSRLEQELLFVIQRIDVAEELDRLDTHLAEAAKILSKPESVGRRLDFMMQEFNREANTLASKSINTDITNSAVEIKVLIEQMREQLQNLE